jgi:hypothetical protein
MVLVVSEHGVNIVDTTERSRSVDISAVALLAALALGWAGSRCAQAEENPFRLDLPEYRVADRVSTTRGIKPHSKQTWAELDGPGCINHIWVTLKTPGRGSVMVNRKIVMRIYFDGAATPHVEAPVGDFFGAMHGVDWYDVNTEFLSVKPLSGYNSYFQMPFARSARIEFEAGGESNQVYLQVDWHRYPGAELKEPRRFCACWRRECPSRRYGEEFLMLDADGPGQLIGFVYGVRLIDNVDRWSHGGAENIYLDGDGKDPAYIRGIGGEDTFGTSYGGAIHPPETHLYAAMPYYMHEDIGEARPAQRVVGYRFFVKDVVPFHRSIHMRFGCMENDLCTTVYWYQTGPVRPFVKLPDFDRLLPGTDLARGEVDLPLPESGAWWVKGPLENAAGEAVRDALAGTAVTGDPLGADGWTRYKSLHGFVDFNHRYRPQTRGVAVHWRDKAAVARTVLKAPDDTTATLRFAWDDHLVVRLNGQTPIDLGEQRAFRTRSIQVSLRKGPNVVALVLSNTQGTNHGAWAFAFRATAADGTLLLPQAE